MDDMTQYPGLDGRAREANGQTDPRQLTTKIKYLREQYGAHFANGWDGECTLGELLEVTKFPTLTQYIRHYRHMPMKKS
jgi:hypothetical protein